MDTQELQKILDEHKEWLKTYGEYGCRAVLDSADLRGVDLNCADLRGASLRGADLRSANLYRVDLTGASLRGATLSANLNGADLSDADLSGADLSGANLENAFLRGAILSGANLSESNLRNANLRNANLSGADLKGADLNYADIDDSALPLCRGGLNVNIDDRQATQILYHLLSNVLYSKNTSSKLKNLLSNSTLVAQANKFHKVDECGQLSSKSVRQKSFERSL